MAYRMVYLRIRSSGYNFGWTSDTDQAAFEEESRRIFQELGWNLHTGHNCVGKRFVADLMTQLLQQSWESHGLLTGGTA